MNICVCNKHTHAVIDAMNTARVITDFQEPPRSIVLIYVKE